MKIEYNMNDNYLKCYDEAQGIISNKKKLYKNPKKRIKSYLLNGIIFNIEMFLMFLILKVMEFYGDNSNVFAILILSITFFTDIIYFLGFFINYSMLKNKEHAGILEFNEIGITDISNTGIIVTMPWEKIEALVLGKYTATFITSEQLFYFINVSTKENVLKAVKKYNNKLLIIDKTKNNIA